VGSEVIRISTVLRGQTRDRANVGRVVLRHAVSGRVRRQVGRLRGVMDAVRLKRRVRTVLLDQTGLAGMLEGLRRRETLVVRIGVVLKKRQRLVAGWLTGRWSTAVMMVMIVE
jgi:hypothetical protein